MASIGGISLKNVKNFKDHEGMTITQGDVWYKGEKLGFYTEDSWGGPNSYDFNERSLDEVVKTVAESDFVKNKDKKIFNLDILLWELNNLREDEKIYKKALKAGYRTLVIADDGFHYSSYWTKDNPEDAIKSTYHADWIKKIKSKMFKDWTEDKIKIYGNIEDFNINVAQKGALLCFLFMDLLKKPQQYFVHQAI